MSNPGKLRLWLPDSLGCAGPCCITSRQLMCTVFQLSDCPHLLLYATAAALGTRPFQACALWLACLRPPLAPAGPCCNISSSGTTQEPSLSQVSLPVRWLHRVSCSSGKEPQVQQSGCAASCSASSFWVPLYGCAVSPAHLAGCLRILPFLQFPYCLLQHETGGLHLPCCVACWVNNASDKGGSVTFMATCLLSILGHSRSCCTESSAGH